MKTFTSLRLALFILLLSVSISAQSTDTVRKKLELTNAKLTDAFLKKDVNELMKFYDREAISMPELHHGLYSPEDIRQYFTAWFKTATVSRYQKNIFEVLSTKGHVVEIGTFKNEFSVSGKKPFLYDGKYMNVWKIGKGKKLTLVSEIWGASADFDKALLPQMENKKTVPAPDTKTSPKLAAEVQKRNEIIAATVMDRNGEMHSTIFTEDAIYMPYYKPILSGIKSVREYFIEHESPAVTIESLSINASKIINMGEFVLEHGYYAVSWRYQNNSGSQTGKSLNLWKRDPNGILMMHRQMVNHDQ